MLSDINICSLLCPINIAVPPVTTRLLPDLVFSPLTSRYALITMTVCEIPGRPDLYGLGIRTAFYIQWSAAVLVAFLDESELPPIRHLGLLLSAASTLSIIITASSSPPFTSSSLQPTSSSPLTLPDTPPLQPADVYITLLLASGIYLPLIPPSFVRLLTLCSPYWNPFRFLRERPSPASRACSFLLLLAVSSVAVWFYTTFLPGWWGRSDADGCDQYGFLFAPISLDDRAYVVFNALLYIVIIVACVGVMLSKVGCTVRTWAKERKRRKVRYFTPFPQTYNT